MTNLLKNSGTPPKALFASNTAWSLFNFRAPLIQHLIDAGWQVTAAAPVDDFAEQLARLGCRFIPVPMDNKGVNPARDLALFVRLYRVLRAERPTVFLGCTIKPNIYGSIAAQTLGIPVINNITGLGTAFIRKTWVTHIARGLYKVALLRSRNVFFENQDDLSLFVTTQLVDHRVAECLPITGVDLSRFAPRPSANPRGRPFTFMLVSRMLWDKGVGEFVEAARNLRHRHPDVRFRLLGFINAGNRTAISREQIAKWQDDGIITYVGAPPDVRPYIADTDCVVLPSYREGLPVALLEAASMAKPIITTNTVGCREVVEHGVNGFLVNVADADDLAEKMEQVLSLSPEQRINLGQMGRKKMESVFDDNVTTARYMEKLRAVAMECTGYDSGELGFNKQ